MLLSQHVHMCSQISIFRFDLQHMQMSELHKVAQLHGSLAQTVVSCTDGQRHAAVTGSRGVLQFARPFAAVPHSCCPFVAC